MAWMARSFLLVVISVLSSLSLARIATVSVEEKGLSTVLIADKFGIAAGGYINFDVTTNEEVANGNNLTRCVQQMVSCLFVLQVRCAYMIVGLPRNTLPVMLCRERGQGVLVDVVFDATFKHGDQKLYW